MLVVRFSRGRMASPLATRLALNNRSRRRLHDSVGLRFSRVLSLALVLVVSIATHGSADVIVARKTSHLSFTASVSPDVVKPGGRLSLAINVTPKKRMHVYAPGTKYRAVKVTLNKHPSLKPSRLV